MRLMVMPVGRSLGFFADHRQKIFRTLPITGGKYFVPYRAQAKPILVFSGSQAKTISYSTEHRQKLFCTLPITGKTYFGFFRITGKNYFVLYRAQAKTILYPTDHRQNLFWFFPDHRQKLFRTLPSTGKNYFVLYRKDISVSTSWWEVANHIRYGIRFTVRILGGITHYLSLIPLTLERSKDRLSLVYPP